MATAKDWARGAPANDTKKPKGNPHIVEEHIGGVEKGQIRVHAFASKKEAKAFGMGLRAQGKTAFMWAKDSPHAASNQHPDRVIGGGGDGVARDEQGRFASA